jgi:hypothetical protein
MAITTVARSFVTADLLLRFMARCRSWSLTVIGMLEAAARDHLLRRDTLISLSPIQANQRRTKPIQAILLRQIRKQQQQVHDGRPDIIRRNALVQPMTESITVLDEKRTDAIARDVQVAKPHAVAGTGRH